MADLFRIGSEVTVKRRLITQFLSRVLSLERWTRREDARQGNSAGRTTANRAPVVLNDNLRTLAHTVKHGSKIVRASTSEIWMTGFAITVSSMKQEQTSSCKALWRPGQSG